MDNKIEYPIWQLQLIKLIVKDETVTEKIKINEMNCVVNNDFGDYYNDGDNPNQAWESEKEEIRSSGN